MRLDARCKKLAEGLRFVQLVKNRAVHSGIERTPYEALFVCKAKVGLTTSSLPEDVLQDVKTDEEFGKTIESIRTAQEQEETDGGTPGRMHSVKDVNEYVIHDGGNQTSGEAMVTEQSSVSTLTEDPFPPVAAASVLRTRSMFIHL
ncbi:integrase core domain protein [Plakobranchus ocellatus]|uniref:Integrase core domain protein n=1 Tax=Plakobranchus ocellatus TaxID=259542 RepID=A0AAV4CLM0_9GAST|nr:integrase core domain protein [Plakobranchus ocellatus]